MNTSPTVNSLASAVNGFTSWKPTVESVITAEATIEGGDINIDPIAVVLKNSQLIASASKGKGGNVTVIADAFITSPLTLDPLGPVIDVTGGTEDGSIALIVTKQRHRVAW